MTAFSRPEATEQGEYVSAVNCLKEIALQQMILWTPEHIQRTMGAYASFGNRRATITYPPQMPQSLWDWFKPFQKTSHIYWLYLHYCYLLGILPKKTTYRPASPYLKEKLRKLDELSEQVRYMSKYGIETFDDLYADRDRLRGEMDKLVA